MTERLLAFDTTGFSCSAALWRDGAVIAARFEMMERGQAERLMPMIEEVMAEGGESYADLDFIAVTRGPGAFTGLRLGLAAARGLALAAGCPVLGVTSFEAVFHGLPVAERAGREVWVVIESKREDFYLQRFDAAGAALGAPQTVMARDIADRLPTPPALVAGNGAARLGPALPPGRAALSGAREAEAALFAPWAARRGPPAPDAPRPQPLYLRPPDVSFPKERR